jgi:choline kinase
MRAIILAAGQGLRLKQSDGQHIPKVLLEFGGKTLLERHLLLLRDIGVDEVVLALGFRHELIEAELDRLQWLPRPEIVINPDYSLGSVLTVHVAAPQMTRGGDVLLMDGDVLYDTRIARALTTGQEGPNRVLLHREFEAGEEPVKLCIKDGELVEFRKRLPADLEYDTIGESVGFFRLDQRAAIRLVEIVAGYVTSGRAALPHEEALRDLFLECSQKIEVCDVTGAPWMEIDFPDDVSRAATKILPQLLPI